MALPRFFLVAYTLDVIPGIKAGAFYLPLRKRFLKYQVVFMIISFFVVQKPGYLPGFFFTLPPILKTHVLQTVKLIRRLVSISKVLPGPFQDVS